MAIRIIKQKIDQTIIGNGMNGTPHGNCLSACLSMILDISLSEIPNFAEIHDSTWFLQLWDWIKKYDFDYYGTRYGTKVLTYKGIDGYYIVNGKSPNFQNSYHSVVFYKGKLFHDPNPSRKGLATIDSCYMIERKRKNG